MEEGRATGTGRQTYRQATVTYLKDTEREEKERDGQREREREAVREVEQEGGKQIYRYRKTHIQTNSGCLFDRH